MRSRRPGDQRLTDLKIRADARAVPDVVLMDIRMPGLNGIEATRALRHRPHSPQRPRILVLTTFDLDEYAFAALRAGADGFLLKDTLTADLVNAIRIVAAGQAIIAPSTARRLIAHFAGQPETATPDLSRLDTLTIRERDVFELVGQGRPNSEIATALFLSEGTVKTDVSRILTRLSLRDPIQAAHQLGIVP